MAVDLVLKEHFAIESLGISEPTKRMTSKDDEKALSLLSSVTTLKAGRYETGLLWRYDKITLPDSRAMAAKRHICLQKRMKREPELAAAICSKMAEYEKKGYIRKLSAAETKARSPNDWYLPIFPVSNVNKPGKIRIVFDAAAKAHGVSLNSFLLTGPDQLVSLLTVLYKFREFKIAVVGDIREMFFQVAMKPEDQRSQMILWNDGQANEDPSVYAVTVMTFGAACSPSSAHYVKNINADRFIDQFPRAAECIKYEHYVDDMLSSVETEEEAVQLAKDVHFVHSQAGFEIRNWQSNSERVTTALNNVVTTEMELSLNTGTTAKVLGMWWDTVSDTFTFRLSPKQDSELLTGSRAPTKREVLRTLMAIYDPIGLIGHFLMFLKILLQEIWRSGCGWDEEITGKLREKWETWIAVLPGVCKVRVPRCYRTITSTKATKDVQLHVFCDASENGMAAVAYFRFEENGVVECAIVGSKTRVAPLKFLSIPRLELQAAVIGARLADSIVKSHRMNVSRRVFWTDSRDVVCWIRSDHRRYTPFVAFRVSELLETTRGDEWKWVPTRSNVADDGTKWQRLPELERPSRWFTGPAFLLRPESEWPGDSRDPGVTMEEARTNVLHHTIIESLVRVERFSKWKRLVRAVAYVHRYIENLQRRVRQASARIGVLTEVEVTKAIRTIEALTQDEIIQAERTIYRQVQQQAYSEEIRSLNNTDINKPPGRYAIPKSSSLYQLNPVVDSHGVLRMKGRIEACTVVDESVKHPILLPRHHYVTNLIMAEYHHNYCHQNHQTAINEIRSRFCIPRLRMEFNRMRRNCQHCKVRRATPQQPAMGNLPPARLAAFQRPFSYTGIDYFGPMSVAVGRRVEKRWGVLMTCMTTRGIHIELAHSLSSDSCILALRRFIARRGSPLEIFSDQGTNFIGASRELREALQTVDETKMAESFAGQNTKWTFNPPAAPHFGGCWERLVQSVKKNLNEFRPPRLPTDEILGSLLTEVEMIVNSRPLTHLPLDTDTEPPLTPNHFLLGTSNGSRPPIALDDRPAVVKRAWKLSQRYADEFWKKWVSDYLPTLTRRTKWFQPVKPIEVGALALIADNNHPRNYWPRGRIIKVVRAKDGQVRRATIQTGAGLLERPTTKIAILDVSPSDEAQPMEPLDERSEAQACAALGGECYGQ